MSARKLLLIVLALGIGVVPLAADAQAPGKVPRIGVLWPLTPSTPSPRMEAFRQGLRELGYVEGRNVILEYRYADGRDERFRELAAELVRLNVNVIVAVSLPAVRAARNATRTIPIVMPVSVDPVGVGLVASLARPGGNLTGLSSLIAELGPKRLELLREAAPRATRVAVLWNPTYSASNLDLKETQAAARTLGVTLQSLEVRERHELERAFATITRERAEALITLTDPFTLLHLSRIIDLAARSRLPAMYGQRDFVDAGGLMSYGPSLTDMFRRAATYVDRILKGATPGTLPIEQPTRFELVINLKTAKALGLTIPQSVLIRADQVIQ